MGSRTPKAVGRSPHRAPAIDTLRAHASDANVLGLVVDGDIVETLAMRVDVDVEMALAIKAAGGEVLDETLPAKRELENADYIFRGCSVVAELKRCEQEIIFGESFIAKVSALHREFREKWRREGRSDVPLAIGKRVRIVVNDYPEEFQFAVSRLLQDRFATALRKANAQIKTTRDHLMNGEAKGLLLLCIDGDSGMTLELFLHVIDRLLRRNGYSGIHGVALFAANCGVIARDGHMMRPFLFAGKHDRPGIDLPIKQRLLQAWAARIAALGGPPVVAFTPESPVDLLRQRPSRVP